MLFPSSWRWNPHYFQVRLRAVEHDRHHRSAATAHIANSGIRPARPCNPRSSPRLNAPHSGFDPASATVKIESRLNAPCPDQNAGHTDCTNGQRSCMDNCEVVETTISATSTLHRAKTLITRRHTGVARRQLTGRPTHSSGMLAPTYRGPNESPAFHQ